MQLTSFGCSLTLGTGLADHDTNHPRASLLTWPALVAERLGWRYRSIAQGGCGNLSIADRVLLNRWYKPNDFLIINWTYLDRFDYVNSAIAATDHGALQYTTARPGETNPINDFYYRNLHSEFRDKLTSLIYIKAVIDLLVQKNCLFIMTAIDDMLFDRKYFATPQIVDLQDSIRPYIQTFEGKNFLAWARDQGHAISGDGHPLDSAHRAAAGVMLPIVQQIYQSSNDATRHRA